MIYLDVAGLTFACGVLDERGLASVAIPGEVKRELDAKGMPRHMQSLISRGMVRIIHEPAIKRIKKHGNGEDHAMKIAQAMIAGGQEAAVITSDKGAIKRIADLGIAASDIVEFARMLADKGVLTKPESEKGLQRLADSGIIPARYGPSP